MATDIDQNRLDAELARLRKNGLVLPRHSGRAAQSYGEAVTQTRAIQKAAGVSLDNLSYGVGKTITSDNLQSPEVQRMLKENQAKINAMDSKRTLSRRMQRTSASVTPSGTDAQNAIPRFYDPLEYWDLSGLPWNVADEGHRHKLHKWLRLYYATHYLVPTLIDIFTRFPLIGMEFECFDGDTRVLTKEGTRRIESLSGHEPEVLNGYGQWQKVPVEAHGLREIWEVTVCRNKREKVIRTTKNHRWLLESNRSAALRATSGPGPRPVVLTAELQTGDKLASCFPINQIKKGSDTHPSPFGVAHGFTFGDGSRTTSGDGCFVELNGKKDQALSAYFPNSVDWTPSHPSARRVGGLPGFFKDVPSIAESTSYLYGWLAGYFAADGTVSKKGAAYLDSANRSNVEYFRDVCTRLGIKTAAIYTYSVAKKKLPSGRIIENWQGYRLPIAIQSLTTEFFIIDEHRRRYEHHIATGPSRSEEWTVVSIRATGDEDMVYCATVEGSESFVLEDNILTGNCKDHALTDIYEEIFMRNLQYDEFFVSLGREYWCALPGELIQGSAGPVAIEEVQAGNLVLTHKGVLKPVKGASSREYSGKYVKLRPHYGLPMRYTYGHPFLVNRDDKTQWVPVEEIQITDELFVPVDQRVEDRTQVNVWETLQGWLQVPSTSELGAWSIPDHITWTDSEAKYRGWVHRQTKNLTPGDVWKRLGPYAQHSPLKADIDLTDDLLWFFGLYLAEGAVTKDGVRISLHAKEMAYAERVVAIAADFGLNADVVRRSSENGINVNVYSIAFGAWIKSLLGTSLSGKWIAEWMMILPAERQAHLLRGYFDGGGHYGDVRVHAASASLSLALQVERMIRRQGIVTTINECNSTTVEGYDCRWWMVGPAIGDTRVFLERLGVPGKREFQKRQFGRWQGVNEGYWVKVFQIYRGEYSGPVYNVEVEDDHSYVGSVATHNCVGEAFPLGSFDEDLGVWEHEELINPEDVVIDNFPFLNTQQLKIVPPDYLRRIAQTKSPAREWYMLQEHYADLIPYLLKGEHIPISPVMIRQVANKMNNWDDHGTPILLRSLRTLLYEEKLLASQEAIAERLYSPLILAKLGIMDMGEGLPPWIPTPAELESVRDDLDIALASDFRLMVHHFGLDITSVFGREQMPRLGDDFDRIERRIMQVFGVNPSLLSAGSNSQPYASSALQAEFMNQILKTFQNMLKAHYRERALVVAEAQGHQDYEKRGQTRVPIFERVVVYDEEGNKEIREVPKLLVPDLTFATFDLRDEATERQFLMELRQMGVPLPNADLLIGVDWKYKDKINEYNTELKEQTIAQQQAKMETYYALTVKGLPVPLDLKAECESVLIHGPGAGGGAPQGAMQGGGAPGGAPGTPSPGGPGAGPGGGGIVMPPAPLGLGAGPGTAPPGGGPPATSPMQPGPAGTVPQVSNERRPGLTYNTSNEGVTRLSVAEGSELDKFLGEYPDLGLPFVDFVSDMVEPDDELGKLSSDELHELYEEWPKYATTYQRRVADEVAASLAARLAALAKQTEADATLTPEWEKDFVLKRNQELQKTASNDEIIVETPTKSRILIEQPKKYSIIDDLHADIDYDIDLDSKDKSEPTDNAESKSA